MEGQQFTAPQAGGQLQVEGRQKAPALRFGKVQADFLLWQNFHFPFFELWQLAALGGVGEEQPLRHRLLHAVVQQRVDAPHHSGAETGIFQRREVFALNPSTLLEVVVKPLDLNGGQLVQGNISNSGDDVVLDVVRIVRFGVGPDAGLGVDLVPRFHPRTDRVSPGFGCIQPLAFADRGFEFFLDLGLRLAQHVLDDALSALRVIARGVPTLPASVLSLADVPFPVRSSFRHGISPFRNEQYRNQGNKATEKWNCYQKVIICLRKFPPLFFVYGGAIFALPGASSLFIARQILNRLLCRLFVFISVKVKPFLAYTSSTCFLISGLMRKRNISVLGAVTMFSTSDSSSLDCFLGHGISDDIKKVNEM